MFLVTGVVLSNGSLAVAFHDNLRYLPEIAYATLFLSKRKLILPQELKAKQLGPFTVGLADGDGCLQVNHWRRKNLQFRFVIALSDKPLNLEMLKILSKIYGGFVRFDKQKEVPLVKWVIDDKATLIKNILPLFEIYPPLTTRLHLQFIFFKKYIIDPKPEMEKYFIDRKNKYNQRPLSLLIPYYFSD